MFAKLQIKFLGRFEQKNSFDTKIAQTYLFLW